jgi:hypothetical protein
VAKKHLTPDELASLKEAMNASELEFDNAKLAYFRRATYKDREITYEVLKECAETYIANNHAFQKAQFGRVHVKLSVARLLRE